eukprot:803900-Heterocapsa_arctica.AAC.1
MAMARGLPDGPVPPKTPIPLSLTKTLIKSYSRSIISIMINAPTIATATPITIYYAYAYNF